jgi:hypothetical protein
VDHPCNGTYRTPRTKRIRVFEDAQ